MCGPQPLVHRAVLHQRRLAGPAGHQHNVGVGELRQRGVGEQRKAAGVGALRSRILCNERELDVGQAAEHLVRPHRVQSGEAVVDEDGDLHW